jgi:hypothetical protein
MVSHVNGCVVFITSKLVQSNILRFTVAGDNVIFVQSDKDHAAEIPPIKDADAGVQGLVPTLMCLGDSHYNHLANQATGTEVRQQLMFLRICHASILRQSAPVEAFQETYGDFLKAVSGLPGNTLNSGTMISLSRLNLLCDDLHRRVTDLVSVTSACLQHVSTNLSDSKVLQRLRIELQWEGENLQRMTASLREPLYNCEKSIDSYRTYRESQNLQHLTSLACVFLPLTLSASMLSMQTRLLDLGSLMWDFAGITLVSGTATLLLLSVFRFAKGYRRSRRENEMLTKKQYTVAQDYLLYSLWAGTLSAFVVSMITKDEGATDWIVIWFFFAFVVVFLIVNGIAHRNQERWDQLRRAEPGIKDEPEGRRWRALFQGRLDVRP